MAKSKNSKSSKEKGDLIFLNKSLTVTFENGQPHTHEETVSESKEDGLKIKYYDKKGEVVDLVLITSKGNEFLLVVGSEEKIITKEELVKEVKNNKKLTFALNFVKSQKGGARHPLKRASKASKRSKASKASKRSKRSRVSKASKRSKRSKASKGVKVVAKKATRASRRKATA